MSIHKSPRGELYRPDLDAYVDYRALSNWRLRQMVSVHNLLVAEGSAVTYDDATLIAAITDVPRRQQARSEP